MGAHDGWQHCPRCGATLSRDGSALRCPACGSTYYANPAPTVTALVLDDDGRLLLARRAREPDLGAWDTIGGFLEEDEAPLAGLARELAEETGLAIVDATLVDATVDRYGGGPGATFTLNLAYAVRAAPGEPAPADDVSELRWFSASELPPADAFAFSQVGPLVHAFMGRRR